MGMSSYRFLVILLLINIMIGMSQEIYLHSSAASSKYEGTIQNIGDAGYSEIESEASGAQQLLSEQMITENTLGSGLRWAGVLINAFAGGLIPIPAEHSSDMVEEMFIWALQIFRFMLSVLACYTLFLIVKNRKTD